MGIAPNAKTLVALGATLVIFASAPGLHTVTFAQQAGVAAAGIADSGTSHTPDILGFTLGMPGGEAEGKLGAFYADQKRDLYLKRFRLDPAQPDYLGFAAPSSYGLRDDEDNVVLMFSGTASANQLLYMTRDAVFPRDHRPTLAQTTTAIKNKYGEPSAANGSSLGYFYHDGALLKSNSALLKSNNCAAAANQAAVVRRPAQGGMYNDYLSQASAAASLAPPDCDAAVVFSLQIAQDSAGARAEQLDSLSAIAIAFRNLKIARAQDSAAFAKSQEHLQKGRNSAPSPPPRL